MEYNASRYYESESLLISLIPLGIACKILDKRYVGIIFIEKETEWPLFYKENRARLELF
jgi:hypothetical protein